MTRKDIQQGVRVSIPCIPPSTQESKVYYLKALLKNWNYPHPYLIIKEGFTGEDNVQLYMRGDYPQFCVESFPCKELTIYQPTTTYGS